MRRIFAGSRGLAGGILVVVIAWALAAVLMLTGTLIAARDIEDRVLGIADVRGISSTVSEIDRELDAVRLTEKTGGIAVRILRRAEPLDDRLTEIVTAARDIDGNAVKILGEARSINDRVVSINSKVHSINDHVASIGSSVASINDAAGSINALAGSINSTVRSINSNAGSIGGTVVDIERTGRGVLTTARSIDPGVANINDNADQAIRGVRPITGDLADVLDRVGEIGPRQDPAAGHAFDGGLSIHGHANGIDCDLDALDPGATPAEYCGR